MDSYGYPWRRKGLENQVVASPDEVHVGLKTLPMKRAYESDMNSLIDEFYIPALSASTKYDRLTGFFSSTSLAIAARGLAGLVEQGGSIRLIASPYLTKEDTEVIRNTSEAETVQKRLLGSLDGFDSVIERDHVEALGWLLREKRLEIRIAIVLDDSGNLLSASEIDKSGIFHQKVGILTDRYGDSISFSGSINETAKGWLSNIEEFKVFRRWDPTEGLYYESDREKFERYWTGRSTRLRIEPAPAALENKMIQAAPEEKDDLAVLKKYRARPRMCGAGRKIELWPFQVTAVRSWVEAGRRGLLEMATGTGKTIVGIACMCDVMREHKPVTIVIASPFRHIGDQWLRLIKELKIGCKLIIADSSNPNWSAQMIDAYNQQLLQVTESAVILTTHNTFALPRFDEILQDQKVTKLLIADEVHGIGAPVRAEGLSKTYDLRLGLSATPRRWFDDEGTNKLVEYFGGVVYELPLGKAMELRNPLTGNPILVPYRYHPYFVDLAKNEYEEYGLLTTKITKAFWVAKEDPDRSNSFTILCNQRADIVRNASAKYEVFEGIVENLKERDKLDRCLVYCSPEQLSKLQSIMNSKGIRQHKFTEEENPNPDGPSGISERLRLLELLKTGHYQALLGIRVLDEGVDVPSVDKAIFMASTGNPRQFIQRRGRILRYAEGKTAADIYDILVLPTLPNKREVRDVELSLLKKEIARYEEFAGLATNRSECLLKIIEAERKSGLYG